MSLQSQIKNMKKLGELLSQDLGYVFGERESGPNGIKKEFLATGRTFLSTLGKDLGFKEQNVHVNKAGIAVSGEVHLYGMWNDGSGLSVVLEQFHNNDCGYYRTIRHMKDHTDGRNNFISLAELKAGNYGDLIAKILLLREGKGYERIAA